MFYHDAERVADAIASLMLYSALQALSCVAMHVIMKKRYGVSEGLHLAFALERHRIPIQCMMAAWLPMILNFTTVHYGTDFSFQFDFESWSQW